MPATAQQMKQLVQVAREAVSDFKEADADLRRIAFERILDHMLTGDGPDAFEQNGAVIIDEPEEDWPPKTKVRRTDLVSLYFEIEPEHVAALFDLSDDEPILHLSPEQVPQSAESATRLIALLVLAARAALGLDTTIQEISEAIRDHRARVPASSELFAAFRGLEYELQQMREIILLGQCGRPDLVVRLNSAGVEAARERAGELAA